MRGTLPNWNHARVSAAALPYFEWLLPIAAVIALLIALVTGQKSELELEFDAYASSQGGVQVYYASDAPFSELQTHVWPLQIAAKHAVSMRMATRDVRQLRIDPSPGMAELRICNLRLSLSDGSVVSLASQPMRAGAELTFTTDGTCAVLSSLSGSSDPQALVDLSLLDAQLDLVDETARKRLIGWLAIGAVLLAIFAMVIFRRERATAVEHALQSAYRRVPAIYFVLAVGFGSLLALVMPPGAVPDEPAHTAKVILVENGQWLGVEPGRPVSPSLAAVQGPFQDFLNPALRFEVQQVLTHSATPLPCRTSIESLPSSAASYSPTLYIVPAYVLNLACTYGGSTGTFVYGGRIANLLFAALLTAIGIQYAGGARWALFAVALLPVTLSEQASMTADSPILGLTFCLLGVQAGLATGVLRPGVRVELALLTLGLALGLSKPGYAWTCVGFLFAWKAYRQAHVAVGRGVLLTVVVPWLVHVVWTLVSAGEAMPRAGVDPVANVRALTTATGDVLALLVRTFGPDNDLLWSSLIGRLGWLDVSLRPMSYALATVSLLLTLGMRQNLAGAAQSGRWVPAAAAVCALGATLLPVIPMYLYWTPQGAILIEGLQGRYFLPVLAFLLCWVGVRAPAVLRAPTALFLVAVPVLTNADAVLSVVARYYT